MSVPEETPINLTDFAAGMSWRDACASLHVCHKVQTAMVSIQPLDESKNGQSNDGASDTIYVIVTGYGVLRFEQKDIECTAGDVLFVPRGHPHRLERMNGQIQIWKIELLVDSAGEQ
jgi:mannose-6-phosphate isomerase-like protein (cupin superfamily)